MRRTRCVKSSSIQWNDVTAKWERTYQNSLSGPDCLAIVTAIKGANPLEKETAMVAPEVLSKQESRYPTPYTPQLADGWSIERLVAPSRLFGANGLRTGPDNRIYIAQVTGSQISALDVTTGHVEAVSAKGGDIVAPDDVAFDSHGNLFATEVFDGRVAVLETSGRSRVLNDALPSANGITVFQDRLFINECRPGGRLMELDKNTGTPRILLEDIPQPNAMEVGPDGKLYFPVMGANQIWRIDPEGGDYEVVTSDLGVPVSVKFDKNGQIVTTQVASGQVIQVDPKNGDKTLLAQLTPGLDNCTFVNDKLYVSNFTGEITEIADGATRAVLPGGLTWPLDLTVGSDGKLYIADGTYFHVLLDDGTLQTVGMLFSPGYPGFLRGVTASGDGEFVVTTAGDHIIRYRPAAGESEVLAEGLDQLYGVAIVSGGTVVAAVQGAGTVVAVSPSGQLTTLASDLSMPTGVAASADGSALVSESGAGRVLSVSPSGTETVVDGLQTPQGVLEVDGLIYIVDAGSKSVIEYDPKTNVRTTIAADLPIGAPPGVTPKPLLGMPPFSGPQGPFAGIAQGPDGTLYVSADAEGSVLALRKDRR